MWSFSLGSWQLAAAGGQLEQLELFKSRRSAKIQVNNKYVDMFYLRRRDVTLCVAAPLRKRKQSDMICEICVASRRRDVMRIKQVKNIL